MLNKERFPQIVNKNAKCVVTKVLNIQSFDTRLALASASFFFFSGKNSKKKVTIKVSKKKV